MCAYVKFAYLIIRSRTFIQAVYVSTDDLTNLVLIIIFAHLDATTILLRELTIKYIYLAVYPLECSNINYAQLHIIGEKYYEIVQRVKQTL